MSPQPTILIVGAGICGRMMAMRCAQAGMETTLIDEGSLQGEKGATWVGAGMLAPWCELETCDPSISSMGLRSLSLWDHYALALGEHLELEKKGSLVVTHGDRAADWQALQRRVKAAGGTNADMQEVEGPAISALEPALAGRFQRGLFFPREGAVNNRAFLKSSTEWLSRHPKICWEQHCVVASVAPGAASLHDGTTRKATWVIDCRGRGAKACLPTLRGVRGELFHVRAPEVKLSRPVRIMHPRYPIYVVPRRDGTFVVGATQIESESLTPVSVQSALELLSALYTLHTGFAEASILEALVQLRPAFPDNLPRIHHQPGLLSINGLFRHGFLLAPLLVDAAFQFLCKGQVDMNEFPGMIHEFPPCIA